MKFIIQTKKDLELLQGKFVIQIDDSKPDKTLMDFNWEFAKENRLRLVSGTGFVSLCGLRIDYDSFEKFQNVFNHYLFDHMIEKGKTTGERFHRLLTNKELDYLLNKMKLENY